jgi:colicin import membrane protein
MEEPRRSRQEFWFVVAAGSGLMLLTATGAYWIKTNADRPQLTLEMAVDEKSQLPPVTYGFAASNAVGELLKSLPPELALDVCASLTGAPARTAKQHCDELRSVIAIVPAASPIRAKTAIAASLPADVVAPPAEPQVPVAAAPVPSMPVTWQAAPIQTAVADSEPSPDATATQTAAVAEPASAAPAGGPALAGVQIASAQTTEQPAFASARAAHDPDVILLSDTTEPVTPTVTVPEEVTVAYWLYLSDMPEGDASDTDGLGGDTTGEDDTSVADAAAAAEAQAKARAAAEAKARAAAEAKARAKAKAAAKALAAALNADNDSGNTANAGKGKDKDQGSSGAGSSGSNADSGGSGNN